MGFRPLACHKERDAIDAVLANVANLEAEFLVEPIDPAFGVDELLAASEERVARGADFEVEFRFGRTRLECVAARAPDIDLSIIGVDPFLHSQLLGA